MAMGHGEAADLTIAAAAEHAYLHHTHALASGDAGELVDPSDGFYERQRCSSLTGKAVGFMWYWSL